MPRWAMRRPAKFGNRAVVIDGLRFDSAAEGRRYQQLRMLERAGEIQDLRVHPRYVIIDALRVGSRREKAIVYEADFAYTEGGLPVVEDVKGVETAVFRLKRRLFLQRYPDVVFRVLDAKGV